MEEDNQNQVLEALCSMCSGDCELAIQQWRRMLPLSFSSKSTFTKSAPPSGDDQDKEPSQEGSIDSHEDGTRARRDDNEKEELAGRDAQESKGLEMIKHNLAVCLLYTGRIDEVGCPAYFPISISSSFAISCR